MKEPDDDTGDNWQPIGEVAKRVVTKANRISRRRGAMDDPQGQSAVTPDKERRIGSALAISAKIADSVFGRRFRSRPWFHCLDTNCGSGWNMQANCPGSPTVFHVIADQHLLHMQPHLLACDRDASMIGRLRMRLQEEPRHLARTLLFEGDNDDAVKLFGVRIAQIERNPEYAVGAVVVDPNGYWYRNQQGIGAPLNTLPDFLRRHPRIDPILNLNMRTYRLQRPHGHAVEPPVELLKSLRPYWMISRPGNGSTNYIVAVGRNIKTQPHRAAGFHDLDSEEGRAIVEAALGTRQSCLAI